MYKEYNLNYLLFPKIFSYCTVHNTIIILYVIIFVFYYQKCTVIKLLTCHYCQSFESLVENIVVPTHVIFRICRLLHNILHRRGLGVTECWNLLKGVGKDKYSYEVTFSLVIAFQKLLSNAHMPSVCVHTIYILYYIQLIVAGCKMFLLLFIIFTVCIIRLQ